jgi:predicted 3-demethylubiquinone-9 3-methyltransferase (glyoxalase superfamily)
VIQRISPCLWFDDQAQAAAEFYVGLFPNSRILQTTHFLEGAPKPAGSVLTVSFTLDGSEFLALNGGPEFTFSPAISLIAYCESQAEVDELWRRFCEGGQPGQCGWLTDRFGVSWQVVPRGMFDLLFGKRDAAAAQRAFIAMMQMTKLDLPALQRAYDRA